MRKVLIAPAIAALALGGPVAAQTNPISQLSWMAGVWRADWQGSKVEDAWGPPTNGEMLAAFKMMKDGKVTRYDFRSIRMVDGKLTLQELGFKGDMSADFGPPLSPVSEIDAKHAVFGGFTFEHSAPNKMTVTIMQASAADPKKLTPTKVNYTRVMSMKAP